MIYFTLKLFSIILLELKPMQTLRSLQVFTILKLQITKWKYKTSYNTWSQKINL